MSEIYISDSRATLNILDKNDLNISVSNSSIIKSSTLSEFSRVDRFSRFQGSSLGRHSYIGQCCVVMNSCIKNFVSVAWNVTIGARNHPINLPSQHSFTYNKYDKILSDHNMLQNEHRKTVLHPDVWVGAGACILSGLNLSPGSVIGANSVVTKDTEPYGIYSGSPANLRRFRFDDKVISQLLDLSWWEQPDSILSKNQEFFKSPPTLESISSFNI